MGDIIPIFPLSLVVFPGEALNLHIFEDRYKELVNDSLSSHIRFGIPAYINGTLCEFGTEVELVSVERVYAGGEMDVKTKGMRVFKMNKVVNPMEGKLYSGAQVSWVEQVNNGDEAFREDIWDLLQELHHVLKVQKEELNNASEVDTFKLAHFVGLSLEKEYELLCMRSERDRQLMVLQHLRNILPVAKETELLRERVKANGHFKNIDPPKF